jgi:hypothetical protein
MQFGECQEESENGLLALFEHEVTDWDSGCIEEVSRHSYDSVDVAVVEQFGANGFFGTAT